MKIKIKTLKELSPINKKSLKKLYTKERNLKRKNYKYVYKQAARTNTLKLNLVRAKIRYYEVKAEKRIPHSKGAFLRKINQLKKGGYTRKKLEKKIRKETGKGVKQTDFSRNRFSKIDTKAIEISQLYKGESEGWKKILVHAYSPYFKKNDFSKLNNLLEKDYDLKDIKNIIIKDLAKTTRYRGYNPMELYGLVSRITEKKGEKWRADTVKNVWERWNENSKKWEAI